MDLLRGPILFIVNNEPPAETARAPEVRGKKRPHHKSRRGCLACKRRRVKCDEKRPCSSCFKRDEDCIHTPADARTRHGTLQNLSLTPPTSFPASNDIHVNLLHLELFHHFQSCLADTLRFPKIWQQVLLWSFQEPFLMHTILSLAATHLCTIQSHTHQYYCAELQLQASAASLFSERLSSPITAQNSEALIAASILMQYISWSNLKFLDNEDQPGLSDDPLFGLSSGVKCLYAKTLPTLWGRDSPFLTAVLYTPKVAIAEAIIQDGQDPRRFVDHFMAIWDDPRYRSADLTRDHNTFQQRPNSFHGCPQPCRVRPQITASSPQRACDTQRTDFGRIAERLSLLFCLVAMSVSAQPSTSESLARLLPDIERCVFTFPVLYSSVFSRNALQHDVRAKVILYHFYRAARLLLTGPATWWACKRSHVLESLFLRELRSKQLEVCVLGEGGD